jgi:hypothetical protein
MDGVTPRILITLARGTTRVATVGCMLFSRDVVHRVAWAITSTFKSVVKSFDV